MTHNKNEVNVGRPEHVGARQGDPPSERKRQAPVELSFTPSRPKSDETVAFAARATGIVPIIGIAIYLDDQLVAESDGEACKYVGGPFPPGQVTVKAVAYSRSGRPGGSTTTRLTVDAADTQAPLVQITHSPSHPTTNQKVTLTAQARDPGGVARIEILVNQRSAATDAGDQCTFVGGPYPKGTVTYGAKAYDKAGNRAWTGYHSFVVADPKPTGQSTIIGKLSGDLHDVLGVGLYDRDEYEHASGFDRWHLPVLMRAVLDEHGRYHLTNVPDGMYVLRPVGLPGIALASEPWEHVVVCRDASQITLDFQAVRSFDPGG